MTTYFHLVQNSGLHIHKSAKAHSGLWWQTLTLTRNDASKYVQQTIVLRD